ncbi:MAG: hypothetical protein QNJ29_08020 [Rhizobiaceae bacterium]|nr:hypothetical protein [Rhizobiaceae bacterium]
MRVLPEFSKILAVTGLCAVVAGCAIRPVPTSQPSIAKFELGEGEITPTTAIVRRIRCEARSAIARITMSYIKEDSEHFAAAYEAGKIKNEDRKIYENISDFNPKDGKRVIVFDKFISRFDFDAKKPRFQENFYNWAKRHQRTPPPGEEYFTDSLDILSLFARSGVAYEFVFDITENNDANMGVLNFGFTGNSTETALNFGGNYGRTRKNVRSFKFAETIGDIVENTLLRYRYDNCNDVNYKEVNRKNYHLPIYGSIDIIDSFSTFAALLVETNFADPPKGSDGKPLTIGKSNLSKLSAQDLLDEIEFTTTINASADPTITLSGSQALNKASAKLAAGRVDKHTLTLLLQPNGIANALEKLELNQIRDENESFFVLNSE